MQQNRARKSGQVASPWRASAVACHNSNSHSHCPCPDQKTTRKVQTPSERPASPSALRCLQPSLQAGPLLASLPSLLLQRLLLLPSLTSSSHLRAGSVARYGRLTLARHQASQAGKQAVRTQLAHLSGPASDASTPTATHKTRGRGLTLARFATAGTRLVARKDLDCTCASRAAAWRHCSVCVGCVRSAVCHVCQLGARICTVESSAHIASVYPTMSAPASLSSGKFMNAL